MYWWLIVVCLYFKLVVCFGSLLAFITNVLLLHLKGDQCSYRVRKIAFHAERQIKVKEVE